jgi:DNA-directed RNA polymerase subunit RPC12/RpoP
MSSVNHNNKCKECGKEFEDVIYQTTCIACSMKNLPPLKPTYTHWQPDQVNCLHKFTKTIVVHTTTTCETTVVVCHICDKWLTQPKTDC